MKTFLTTFLIAAATCRPLYAQYDGIKTRVRFVSWDSDGPTEVAFVSSGKIFEVTGSSMSPFFAKNWKSN